MKKTKKSKKRVPLHHQMKHHVKMAVVPHKGNQFRPHMVRWYGLTVLLVVVTFSLFSSNLSASGSILGVKAPITPVGLLNDTNNQRHQYNEPGLSYSTTLSKAAFLKAQNMFNEQYWAHVAPDGTTPWHWFAKVGYNYAFAGENLAKNFASADAAIAAWMASPEHRSNILSQNYTDVGFAVVDGRLDGKATTLIVALYGEPADAPQVAGAATTGNTNAPILGAISPMAKFGVALQSMNSAVLSSFMLLVFVAFVALASYAYRRQLPRPIRQSWRYHQGLYKAASLTLVAVALVTLYSGGQI
ncbi:MAG: hypothetical protein H6797_04910 [Candidatus Nomurabacteria bacterium]|nr:MAG: hypothetical protein H6797_04910 [Candidatus Nomurabacteria bacterium]